MKKNTLSPLSSSINVQKKNIFILLAIYLFLFSSPAFAQSQPDIAQMFANFSSSAISITKLVLYVGMFIGMGLTFKAALSFKEYAESGGRMQLKTPLGILIAGVLLMALPGTINTATQTLALGAYNPGDIFSNNPGGGTAAAGMSAALSGVMLFVKLVGHIAIVRGILMLSKIAQGAQGAEIGRALTHIFGGAAAVNLEMTMKLLANSVGIILPF